MVDTSTVLVLGGLLYQRAVRDKYLQLMDGPGKSLFGPVPSAAYMMEQTFKLYLKTDICTRTDMLLGVLAENYDKIPPSEPEWREDYNSILERLCISEPETYYTEALCLKSLTENASKIFVLNLQTQLMDLQSSTMIREKITDFTEQMTRIQSKERQMFDIVDDVEQLLRREDKTPTGIAFLDKVLGGGIVFGKHIGVLGPTGGGKTILATQLMTNAALRGYGSLYIQSEQAIENDITQRCITQLLQLDVSELRGRDYKELPDEIKQKLKTLKNLSGMMKAVSYAVTDSDGNDIPFAGAEDIKENIRRVLRSGVPLKFVIVDWLGAFIDRMICGSAEDNSASYQISAASFMDQLNAFCRPLGISLIYFHQTSNEAKAKGSGYKPRNTDGYYFKAFPNKLEYCVQMGVPSTVDPYDKVAWFCCDKVRDALSGLSCIVRLNGSRMRLEETMEGEYHIGPGGHLCRIGAIVDNAPKDGNDEFMSERGSLDAMVHGYV